MGHQTSRLCSGLARASGSAGGGSGNIIRTVLAKRCIALSCAATLLDLKASCCARRPADRKPREPGAKWGGSGFLAGCIDRRIRLCLPAELHIRRKSPGPVYVQPNLVYWGTASEVIA